jgi:hypothetical protein
VVSSDRLVLGQVRATAGRRTDNVEMDSTHMQSKQAASPNPCMQGWACMHSCLHPMYHSNDDMWMTAVQTV